MHRLNHGTYKTHNHLVQEPLLCNRFHGLTDLSNNRTCGTTTGKEQPVASAQQGHRPPWKNNWGVSPGQRELPQRHNKKVDDLEENLQLRTV